MNDPERKAAIFYRENHRLFLNGQVFCIEGRHCIGTVNYCKAMGKQHAPLGASTVYLWQIINMDGQVVYQCQQQAGEKIKWVKPERVQA